MWVDVTAHDLHHDLPFQSRNTIALRRFSQSVWVSGTSSVPKKADLQMAPAIRARYANRTGAKRILCSFWVVASTRLSLLVFMGTPWLVTTEPTRIKESLEESRCSAGSSCMATFMSSRRAWLLAKKKEIFCCWFLDLQVRRILGSASMLL